jgi:hypothetical protein
MKSAAVALAVILSSLVASAQTSMSIQQVSIVTSVPCANRGQGEIVTFTGTLKVLSYANSEASGIHNGVFLSVGDLVGKGQTTGRKYLANGSNEESFKNFVFHPNGGDGDFLFTIDLHVTGKHENFLYHDAREFIVSNDGNNLEAIPEVTACK